MENIDFWLKIIDFTSQKIYVYPKIKFVNVMISKYEYLQQSTKLGFEIKYSILHSIHYMRWKLVGFLLLFFLGGGAGIIREALVDTQHSVLAFFFFFMY